MSNYIVNHESIAKIANLIKWANFNRWGLSMPYSITQAFYHCINKDNFFDTEKLCKALAIENYIAVDCRYKRNTSPEEIESFYSDCINALDDNYTMSPLWENGKRIITPEHIQLFKTLQCYIYQIDSDATCNDAIYKALEELKYDMAIWIIANTDEYINADWK